MQLLTLMVNYDAARWPAKLDQKQLVFPTTASLQKSPVQRELHSNMVIGLEIPSAWLHCPDSLSLQSGSYVGAKAGGNQASEFSQ